MDEDFKRWRPMTSPPTRALTGTAMTVFTQLWRTASVAGIALPGAPLQEFEQRRFALR
ncbi:hypothetical protein [Streptomyces sp. NPDC001307]|uniref:hypothetical protein n=1 Tax=Streptomyces sp. NPDC001307 TaxID=3364560 RepID=UPI00367DAF8D